MLQPLISHYLISPPAIWGKLPGHADFVRSGVRHGESEAWQSWLAEHAIVAPAAQDMAASLPAAFVLPPGTLICAPRRFVLGVIVLSADRAGRSHALLVYQQAHPRWVRRHFQGQAAQPRDWLFWLARAVGRHLGAQAPGEIHTLARSVHALWRLHAPDWRQLGHAAAAEPPDAKHARALALLNRYAGPASADHAAQSLDGVRHLPWTDWPERLSGACAQSAFWQQDAAGGFVNAATRLADLWGTSG